MQMCAGLVAADLRLALILKAAGDESFIKLIYYYQSIQCDSSGPIPLYWQLNQSPGQVTVSWD